jgi:hypothetical protein
VTICVRNDLFKDKGHFGLYDKLHKERLITMYKRLTVESNSKSTKIPFVMPMSIYWYPNLSRAASSHLTDIDSMIALRCENFGEAGVLPRLTVANSGSNPSFVSKVPPTELINIHISTHVQNMDRRREPTKQVVVSDQIPLLMHPWLTFGQIVNSWTLVNPQTTKPIEHFVIDVEEVDDDELGIAPAQTRDEDWEAIRRWANRNGP